MSADFISETEKQMKRSGQKNMLRTVNVKEVTAAIKEMCIEANHFLSDDMAARMKKAVDEEESPLGKQILTQLQENLQIAGDDMIPICQDTGMAVVFIKVGQEVHFEGGSLTDAINQGVHDGYVDGFLRKSVVKDPIFRENTKDNTPAVIYYDFVKGDKIKITFAPKGFGSENKSGLKMLNPSDGINGVIDFVIETVKKAGANPCPPMVIGVGIGGTMDKAAQIAKKALTRDIDVPNSNPFYAELEKTLLEKINKLGIGPQGMGGTTTALAVNVETFPTHIAGLPVAVNVNCHATRHTVEII